MSTSPASPHDRVTAYLREDHARLDALLDRASATDPIDADAFAAFRAGLLRHIAIEEKLLLPAARRARGGEPLARAHDLRVDHGALTSLLVAAPDRALIEEIRTIITPHDAIEEAPDGVYAECEALLTPAESADLAARAAAYPPIKLARHVGGAGVYRTAAAARSAARRIRKVGA